ncbi:hypothetical protein V8C42DRAFT_343711 [Trichoderma barbatum]
MQEISGENQLLNPPELPVGGIGAVTENDENTMVPEEAALQNLPSIEMPAHAADADALVRDSVATETSRQDTIPGEQHEYYNTEVDMKSQEIISDVLLLVTDLHPQLARIVLPLCDSCRQMREEERELFTVIRKNLERIRDLSKRGQEDYEKMLQNLQRDRDNVVELFGFCDKIQEDASSLLEHMGVYEKGLENDLIRLRKLEKDIEYCLHEMQVIEVALDNVLR